VARNRQFHPLVVSLSEERVKGLIDERLQQLLKFVYKKRSYGTLWMVINIASYNK